MSKERDYVIKCPTCDGETKNYTFSGPYSDDKCKTCEGTGSIVRTISDGVLSSCSEEVAKMLLNK